LTDGERVFLTLSNIDLKEPLASISMISSGDDDDEDSCRVRDVERVSCSVGTRISEVGRLKSRLNANNGLAKNKRRRRRNQR
jgi:hypothetical protein